MTVGGAGLPPAFTIYRTSASENAVNAGEYATGTSLSLPARSITTLQAGGTPLVDGAVPDGSRSRRRIAAPASGSRFPRPFASEPDERRAPGEAAAEGF